MTSHYSPSSNERYVRKVRNRITENNRKKITIYNNNIQIFQFLNLNGVFKILPLRDCLKADLILGCAIVELG